MPRWSVRRDRGATRRKRATFVAGLLAAAAIFLGSLPTWAQAQIGGNYALSPNGSILLFSFKTPKARGAGLFDWRAGRLQRLEHFAPSFSPDGRRLVAVSREGLVLLDARTLKVDERLPASSDLSLLVFQPGHSALLGQARKSLILVDTISGRRQTVIPATDFYSILATTFVTEDKILFNAMGPASPNLSAAVEAMGLNKIASSVPYFLKFGEQPSIAFQDLLREHTALRGKLPTGFVASRNGDRIVFLGASLTEAESAQRGIQWGGDDLYLIDHGAVSRVTNLGAYMSFDAISYDGSTAVFGVYPKAEVTERRFQRHFDPWIVDLNTRRIVNLDLPSRIEHDPNFN